MVNLHFPLDSSAFAYVWERRHYYQESPFFDTEGLVIATTVCLPLISLCVLHTLYIFSRPAVSFRYNNIVCWVLLMCREHGQPLHRVALYTRLIQLPILGIPVLITLYSVLAMTTGEDHLFGSSMLLGGAAVFTGCVTVLHSLYSHNRAEAWWYLPAMVGSVLLLYVLQLNFFHSRVTTEAGVRLPYYTASYLTLVVHFFAHSHTHHRSLSAIFSKFMQDFFRCCEKQGDTRHVQRTLAQDLSQEVPKATLRGVAMGYTPTALILCLCCFNSLLLDFDWLGTDRILDTNLITMNAAIILIFDIVILMFRATKCITKPGSLALCTVFPRSLLVFITSSHWLVGLSCIVWVQMLVVGVFTISKIAAAWTQSPLASFAAGIAQASATRAQGSRDRPLSVIDKTLSWLWDHPNNLTSTTLQTTFLGIVTFVLLGVLLFFGISQPQIGHEPLEDLTFFNSGRSYSQGEIALAVCAITPGSLVTLLVVARIYFTPDSANDRDLPWKTIALCTVKIATGASMVGTVAGAATGVLTFFLPMMLIHLQLYHRRLRLQDYRVRFFGMKTAAELEIESQIARKEAEVEDAIQASQDKAAIQKIHSDVEAAKTKLLELRATQPYVIPCGVYLTSMALLLLLESLVLTFLATIPYLGIQIAGFVCSIGLYYEAVIRFLAALDVDKACVMMLILGTAGMVGNAVTVYYVAFNDSGAFDSTVDLLGAFGVPAAIVGTMLISAAVFKWANDGWRLFGESGASMTTAYSLGIGHTLIFWFAAMLWVAVGVVSGGIVATLNASFLVAAFLLQQRFLNGNVLPRAYQTVGIVVAGLVALWGFADGVLLGDYFLAGSNIFIVILVPVTVDFFLILAGTIHHERKVLVVLSSPGSVLPIYVYDALRENSSRAKLCRYNSLFVKTGAIILAAHLWGMVAYVFLEHTGLPATVLAASTVLLVLLVLHFTLWTYSLFARQFERSGFSDEAIVDIFEQAALGALKEEVHASTQADGSLAAVSRDLSNDFRTSESLEEEQQLLLQDITHHLNSAGGAAVMPEDFELEQKLDRLAALVTEIQSHGDQEKNCEAHGIALCIVNMKYKNSQRNRTLKEILRNQGIHDVDIGKLSAIDQETINTRAARYIEDRDAARQAEERRLAVQAAKLEKQRASAMQRAMAKKKARENQMLARKQSQQIEQNLDGLGHKYQQASAMLESHCEQQRTVAKMKGWTAIQDPQSTTISFRNDLNPNLVCHGLAEELVVVGRSEISGGTFEEESSLAKEKGWEAFQSPGTGEIGFRFLSNPRIISYGKAADLNSLKPKPPQIPTQQRLSLQPLASTGRVPLRQKQFDLTEFQSRVKESIRAALTRAEEMQSAEIVAVDEKIAAYEARSDVSSHLLNSLKALRQEREGPFTPVGHTVDVQLIKHLTEMLDEISCAYMHMLRVVLETKLSIVAYSEGDTSPLTTQLANLEVQLKASRAMLEHTQLVQRTSETANEIAVWQQIEREEVVKEQVSYVDSLNGWEEEVEKQLSTSKDAKWVDSHFSSDQALFVSGDRNKATVFDEDQINVIRKGAWTRLCGDTGMLVPFSVPDESGNEFNVEEPSQSTILGNCWLISAIATVATRPTELEKIFVKRDPQRGVYGLRLFNQGQRQLVTVDDTFLVDESETPVFSKSSLPNQDPSEMRSLWPMLLEKAFAKQFHSYEGLEGGHTHEALAMMCSSCSKESEDVAGVPQEVSLNDPDIQIRIANGSLFSKMLKYNSLGYLMGAGSPEGSDTSSVDGIIQGHGYSIIDVKELDGHHLIKLRNPWGNGVEWEGDFSDRWLRTHGRRYRKLLGHGSTVASNKNNDGMFWMSFEDFVMHFSQIYICRLFDRRWSTQTHRGLWSGASAVGGNRVCDSPQWTIHVTEPVQLVVVLTQDTQAADVLLPLWLGLFNIGETEHDPKKREKLFQQTSSRVETTKTWKISRSVVLESQRVEPSSDPYVLAVAALAEGQHRSFGVQICVRPLYETSQDKDAAFIERWEPKVDRDSVSLSNHAWISHAFEGQWVDVGSAAIHNCPQWMLCMDQALTLKLILTQEHTTEEAEIPIWLGVYKLGKAQWDSKKRPRLFRYKRLIVAETDLWSPTRQISLHIPELQACENMRLPYVVVAGAMAEGQRRSFKLEVFAKPVNSSEPETEQQMRYQGKSVLEDLDPNYVEDTPLGDRLEDSLELWQWNPRPFGDGWVTTDVQGEWSGGRAIGGSQLHDSPQWLLHATRAVELTVILTQERSEGEELLPLWLGVFKLGDRQNDPKKRARLFRYKRLRVAALDKWIPAREVSLQVPHLDGCGRSAPYILVAGAMAEGQQRSFDLTICAKSIAATGIDDDDDGDTGLHVKEWVGEEVGSLSPKPSDLELANWRRSASSLGSTFGSTIFVTHQL